MSNVKIKFQVCILNEEGKKDLKNFLNGLNEEFIGFYGLGRTPSVVYKFLLKQKHITIILGEVGKEIVSMTYLNKKRNINRFGIVVKKGWQGQGIGTEHAAFTLRCANGIGLKEIRLSCNINLEKWYHSLGFHVIKNFDDRAELRVEMSTRKEKEKIKELQEI